MLSNITAHILPMHALHWHGCLAIHPVEDCKAQSSLPSSKVCFRQWQMGPWFKQDAQFWIIFYTIIVLTESQLTDDYQTYNYQHSRARHDGEMHRGGEFLEEPWRVQLKQQRTSQRPASLWKTTCVMQLRPSQKPKGTSVLCWWTQRVPPENGDRQFWKTPNFLTLSVSLILAQHLMPLLLEIIFYI